MDSKADTDAKSASATQNRQFLQKTNYSNQFAKGYTTDKNFNNNATANGGQHDAADFKRSVYFTDEVKIRIEKVSMIEDPRCNAKQTVLAEIN